MAADPRQAAFLKVLERVHRHHLVGVETAREIWIVRHADAYTQMPGLDFHFDPPLSPRGRLEATRLGRRLAAVRLDRIHTSPLRRAVETVGTLLEGRDAVGVTQDEDLREVGTDWEAGGMGRRVRRGSYPFAEPEMEVVARAAEAMSRVLDGLDPHGRALVVTHSGWIQIYLAHLLGLRFTRLHWLPRFTSVSVVVTDGDRSVVRSLGDVTHLADLD